MEIPSSVDMWLESAAASFGTPSYVYFMPLIENRVSQLRRAFGRRFALSFAAKSNPNPAILAFMKDHVEYLDVSSIGELRSAVSAGWQPLRISFTGPGKRDAEIREAVEVGIGELILESVREAVLADKFAAELGRVQRVLIRVAPTSVPKGFGDQMAGRPSAFGIDWEDSPRDIRVIAALKNLHVVGIHIYSGTQCLKPDALCENYRGFLTIFREIYAGTLPKPEKLVLGSGLGIPYHDQDVPLDLEAVASGISAEIDSFCSLPQFAGTQLVLELGRYLVGEAGYFLTKIVSIKTSRGTKIGICDGGMNNHLPASGHFGMVMHRNYRMHKVSAGARPGDVETVNLVGPLCTSIDKLAVGVALPSLEEGDVIAINNSGAYGLTASPIHFISHAPPREILVEASGIRDVTFISDLPVTARPADQ
ncbi:type III PLP-dependent enzyme [Rhizobium sp. NTR19]|uniref:Type III PLP-dependent enzyme n=1 Tax=Neorhizobium turbinariae TaxID=2937795 RepID=A0ABT0IX40_9HYPH|nr:type III PLP-dependent enzyme [Neorhizobium turbinariae]MCK8782451.1 type III PLP-dependent enzyme [Neorhizobium turbinariae]